MLHSATTLKELVFLVAFFTGEAVEVSAALHVACASFELVIGKAISALASLVSNASQFHSLTDTIISKIVPAFTGCTSVFIICLTVIDITVSIVQRKGFDAFLADVIELIFTSQNRVLGTEVVDQAEAMFAIFADCFGAISVGVAVFDGLVAGALSEVEA